MSLAPILAHGLASPPGVPVPGYLFGAGLVALLCVMIGTTSFDGLSSTVQWSELGPDLQRAFTGLGHSSARALELAYMAGLDG